MGTLLCDMGNSEGNHVENSLKKCAFSLSTFLRATILQFILQNLSILA